MDSGDGSDPWSGRDGRETVADETRHEDGSDRVDGGRRDETVGDGENGTSRTEEREAESREAEDREAESEEGDRKERKREESRGSREEDEGGESGGLIARARWLRTTDHEAVAIVREVASSLAIVAIIGLLLFAVSGIWPPMVAIESRSMSPNLQKGDLVFVMEEHRFSGGAAHDGTGVVGYHAGEEAGYKTFHEYGDVIVYERNGKAYKTPIIHRARFWVNDGENWYDEATRSYLGGADDCDELANCPAPHAGFITKGDNNGQYDQVVGLVGEPISAPVKPSWITGTAEFRIPWLGEIRLLFGMVSTGASALVGTLSTPGGSVVGALAGVGMVRAVG